MKILLMFFVIYSANWADARVDQQLLLDQKQFYALSIQQKREYIREIRKAIVVFEKQTTGLKKIVQTNPRGPFPFVFSLSSAIAADEKAPKCLIGGVRQPLVGTLCSSKGNPCQGREEEDLFQCGKIFNSVCIPRDPPGTISMRCLQNAGTLELSPEQYAELKTDYEAMQNEFCAEEKKETVPCRQVAKKVAELSKKYGDIAVDRQGKMATVAVAKAKAAAAKIEKSAASRAPAAAKHSCLEASSSSDLCVPGSLTVRRSADFEYCEAHLKANPGSLKGCDEYQLMSCNESTQAEHFYSGSVNMGSLLSYVAEDPEATKEGSYAQQFLAAVSKNMQLKPEQVLQAAKGGSLPATRVGSSAADRDKMINLAQKFNQQYNYCEKIEALGKTIDEQAKLTNADATDKGICRQGVGKVDQTLTDSQDRQSGKISLKSIETDLLKLYLQFGQLKNDCSTPNCKDILNNATMLSILQPDGNAKSPYYLLGEATADVRILGEVLKTAGTIPRAQRKPEDLNAILVFYNLKPNELKAQSIIKAYLSDGTFDVPPEERNLIKWLQKLGVGRLGKPLETYTSGLEVFVAKLKLEPMLIDQMFLDPSKDPDENNQKIRGARFGKNLSELERKTAEKLETMTKTALEITERAKKALDHLSSGLQPLLALPGVCLKDQALLNRLKNYGKPPVGGPEAKPEDAGKR